MPKSGTHYPSNPDTLVDRPTTTTYTASGAQLFKFAATDAGFTFTPASSLTTSGKIADIQADQLTMVVLPDRTGSRFTVTAKSTDSIVHTTDGIVTSVESKDVTLTMPVPTPSYDENLYATIRSSSVEEDYGGGGGPARAGGGVVPSLAGSPAPMSAPRMKDGFDLNTLTRVQASTFRVGDKNNNALLHGYDWTVRTQGGNTIALFEPLPLNQQPAATVADLDRMAGGAGRAATRFEIGYNCHAHAFGLVGVADNQGVSRSFWLESPGALVVRNELYQRRPATRDTQPGDIMAIDRGNGVYAHSAIISATVFDRDQTNNIVRLSAQSRVTTKNGLRPLQGPPPVAPTIDETARIYLREREAVDVGQNVAVYHRKGTP